MFPYPDATFGVRKSELGWPQVVPLTETCQEFTIFVCLVVVGELPYNSWIGCMTILAYSGIEFTNQDDSGLGCFL